MATATKNKVTAEELFAKIETQIDAFVENESLYREFLSRLIRGPRLSMNNMILLWLQLPNARTVKTYRQWQELGRQVKKGETGARLLRPYFRNHKVEVESENNKNETETKDKKVLSGFGTYVVFDITQTEGDDIPESELLNHNVPSEDYVSWLESKVADRGYSLTRGRLGTESGHFGSTYPQLKEVVVADTLPDGSYADVLAHELGHIVLDHVSDHGEYLAHRGEKELEAESFAYILNEIFGHQNREIATIGYIVTWAGGIEEARKALRTSATKIRETIDTLLSE